MEKLHFGTIYYRRKKVNKTIFAIAIYTKKNLNKGMFYYKKFAIKIKKRKLLETTEMSYERAACILEKMYPMKKVDFSRESVREKQISYDVSIIVPVYNAEKYLQACIMSLLKQKTIYSYEIICINDGSDDASLKILNKLCDGIPNITIINQINKGLSAARNAGIKIAHGKYLLFVDSDDILPHNCINLLLKNALESNADIVQGSIAKCNTSGHIYYINKCKSCITCDLLEYYKCNMSGTAWGKLYKRELWNNVEFFDGYAYEDAIIWCNIYPECRKMVVIPEVVYIFRSQENSLFKRQNDSIKCLDSIWIIKQCVQLFYKMKVKESVEWYQMILWQLSVGIITRIRYVSNDDVLQAAFVLAKQIAGDTCLYQQVEFIGNNKNIYKEIENSFLTGQYKKWIAYSEILATINSL